MAIANVAHAAGAVIGWLFGRAVLARWQVLATAVVSLLCVALALLTLYMPWNGDYDLRRGFAVCRPGDYAGAVKWFDLAAERFRAGTRPWLAITRSWARQMQEEAETANDVQNLEIKARYADPERGGRLARELGAAPHGRLTQTDTYFNIRPGRLKLRHTAPGRSSATS